MSRIIDVLVNSENDIFGFFDQVFVFGSCLATDAPNDIDILLVYGEATLDQVNLEKDRVERLLADIFVDYPLDFTTLSKSELQQTKFLMRVPHQKIKG